MKTNKKNNTLNKPKFSRRKIITSSIMGLSLLTVLIYSLVFSLLNYEPKQPGKNEPVDITYTYTEIQENDIKFDILEEKDGVPVSYKVTGLYDTAFNYPINPANNEALSLVIPAVYNGCPVKEIAIPISGTSVKFARWATAAVAWTKYENVRKIIIPKSVEKISYGAFNAYKNVTYMELPFVGTVKGNRNENTSSYTSSFYAIFGDEEWMSMSTYEFTNSIRDGLTFEQIIDKTAGTGNGTIPWHHVINEFANRYMNVPVHLKEIYITDEYTIPDQAFFYSPALEKISLAWSPNIPDDQIDGRKIGNRAFDTAISLTQAILPSEIPSYGEGIFSQCYKLKSVAAGGIETGDISYTELNDDVPDNQVHLPLEGAGSVSVPRTINLDTFYACSSIESMIIPKNVTKIERHAFDSCTNLKNVQSSNDSISNDTELANCYIPEAVEYIGDYAFRSCYSLKNINVPNQVKYMGEGVFNNCTSLDTLTLPFIGKERGNGKVLPEQITDPKDNTLLEAMFGWIFGTDGNTESGALYIAFQAVDGNPDQNREDYMPRESYYIPASLKTVTITDETVVAMGAFMYCTSIESLQISGFREDTNGLSVMQIGAGALGGCTGLKSLSIPFVGPKEYQLNSNGVRNGSGSVNYQLGYIFGTYVYPNTISVQQGKAFGQSIYYYFAPELETVELTHQTYVPASAFYDCATIKNVVIGNETIGSQRAIFSGCSNLESLTIPFVGMGRGLYSRYYNGAVQNPFWDGYWDYYYGYDFDIRNSLSWLFSRVTSNEHYRNTHSVPSTWGHWDCYIPESFKNVTITDEVYYETHAFRGFKSLEVIDLQKGPNVDIDHMHMDSYILTGCSSVSTLHLPFIGRDRNATSVNSNAYTVGYLFGDWSYSNSYNANGYYVPKDLTTITFEDYMTCISSNAFNGISSLVSVSSTADGHQARISQLGSYAFANCTNLAYVELPAANYTYIGNYAFLNCKTLTKISDFTPSTVTQIGEGALSGTSIYEVDLKKYYYLGDRAFANCLQLTSIDFTDAGTQSGHNLKRLTKVGNYLFEGCTNLSDVTLSDMMSSEGDGRSIQFVSNYMFKDCLSLETIDIDGKLSYIPAGLFMGCSNLKDVNFNPTSSSISRIEQDAFNGCKSLTTFILPESLQTIGNRAFQNCTGLTSMRIPRNVKGKDSIPLGTDNTQDRYDTGVFYGCDENKFYLEVFLPEPWPWGYNWNCYFPVYIIGDQTENMFTYEYCANLKGYLINGLNVDEFDFVTPSSHLTVNGTLIFPSTKNGLPVYGLVENCFADYYFNAIVDGKNTLTSVHPFYDVTDYVLGANFVTIGENAFNFIDLELQPNLGTKYRNIYSQKTSVQAKAQTGYECHCKDNKNGDEVVKHNAYPGLCYNSEVNYASNSIVYYKEAWAFRNSTAGDTTPVFLMDALVFELDSESYQYNLGKEVKPIITKVSVNPNYVKYPYDYPEAFVDNDQIYKILYDNGELILESFKLVYSRNVNVGTGNIAVTSNTSKISGTRNISFKINPKKIDIFYESGPNENRYGAIAPGLPAYTAQNHFQSLIHQGTTIDPANINQANYPNLANIFVREYEYNGDPWTFSNFAVGANVFGLPDNFHFYGSLRTTSKDVGWYWVTSNVIEYTGMFAPGILDDALHGGKIESISGFEWNVRPVITNANGVDVTSNFEVNLTLAVYIKPFEIEEVIWDGTWNAVENLYEYEYTGSSIVPKPIVKNATGKVLDPQFKVEVSPSQALIPSDTVYTAIITGYDTKNFVFTKYSTNAILDYNYILFKVVPAKLKISMDVESYLIGENELEFSFDDFQNWSKYSTLYKLSVRGLGLNSYITGKIYTTSPNSYAGWGNTTYRSIDPYDNNSIIWDEAGGNGFKVFLKSGVTGVPDQDITDYYELTLDASVTIEWNKFDYNYTITQHDLPTHTITGVNKGMGIKSYNESTNSTYIEFGADGYEHTLDIQFNNVLTPTAVNKVFTSNGTPYHNFTFRDFGEYTLNLTLTKDRFYPVSKNVTILVNKGEYVFTSLDKEYDRDAVNPLSNMVRRPSDLDISKLHFAYYNRNDTNYNSPLPAAPSEIGAYKFTLTTDPGHSIYFEDCDAWPSHTNDKKQADFNILQRRLIIKVVDTIYPYDSKEYDGQPWIYAAVGDTTSSLNLLPGDSLTGTFMSRDAEIGVYDGDRNGDFIIAATTSWKINNSALGEQTKNYRVVFEGSYEILPLTFDWDIEGENVEYDGRYHYVHTEVRTPAYGYTLYYSESELPLESNGWSTTPTFYIEPGIYTVYVKIEAPHYRSEVKVAVIEITGKQIQADIDDPQVVHYDGFSHGIDIDVTDPIWGYSIKYALFEGDFSNVDLENLTYTEVCPTFTEIGTYNYYVVIEAPNYQPLAKVVTLKIDNLGPQTGVAVQSYSGEYDGEYHGPLLDFNNLVAGLKMNDIYISYHLGDASEPNPDWLSISSLTEISSGVYSIPLFKDANESVTQPYKVTVRVQAHNHALIEVTVTVLIKPLKFALATENFSGVFDNQYHTAILKATNPGHVLQLYEDKLQEANPSLVYRYYFTNTITGDAKDYVTLTVKYSSTPAPGGNTSGFSLVPLRYKDVGNYNIFIAVEAENCESVTLIGTVEILFNNNPFAEFDPSPFTIEYLARAVQLSDMPFKTEHDCASPVLNFYVYIPDGDTIDFNGSLSQFPIANPMSLGEYHLILELKATKNCAAKTIVVDFKIIPRTLILEYDEEIEYTGEEILPEVKAITNTPDVVEIRREAYPLGVTPIEVGDYQMRVSQLVENENYVIDPNDQILPFKIIKRKLYVTVRDEMQYTNPPTKWHKSDNWEVENILAKDQFTAEMETESPQRGDYALVGTATYDAGSTTPDYKDNITINGDIMSEFAYQINILNMLIETPDDAGGWKTATYYDVILDVRVSIKYPPLEMEVEDPSVWYYDGANHSLKFNITSTGVVSISQLYWTLTEEEYETLDPADMKIPETGVTNTFLRREAGTYYVGYAYHATNYEDCIGKAKLVIEPVQLEIEVDPFEKIYDAQKSQVTYKILNLVEKPTSISPKYYYIPVQELKDNRIEVIDLINFFKDGMPATNKKLYNLVDKAPTSLLDAGTYYAFVYIKATANWMDAVGVKEVTVHKRPLYFNYLGNNPFIKIQAYNGHKVVINFGDLFEYDRSSTSNNKVIKDAGLVAGHNIDDATLYIYSMRTSSANARGENGQNGLPINDFDLPLSSTPYQDDGDFEFNDMLITGNASRNVNYANNYYPVINTDSNGDFLVQVIITRVALPYFEVQDYIPRQYDGERALPLYRIPLDGAGEVISFFYKVDEAFNRFNNYVSQTETDVTKFESSTPGVYIDGYYLVYISVKDGQNYYGWVGDVAEDADIGNGKDTYYSGDDAKYKFKKGYVKVIPADVEVKWESLDEMFDINEDGEVIKHQPKPYITDVFGQRVDLEYDAENALTGVQIDNMTTFIDHAGSYNVLAKIGVTTSLNKMNYNLVHPQEVFHVQKRSYLVSETTTATWLHTNWTKTYDESYFDNDPNPQIPWLEGFNLKLTVSTISEKAGLFYRANQFVSQHKVTYNGEDYSDSFEFNLDFLVNVISNELLVEDRDIEVFYDANYHNPNIEVLSYQNGYIISYFIVLCKEDGSYYIGQVPGEDIPIVYSPNIPTTIVDIDGLSRRTFRDVGYYRVFYKVVVGNEESAETGDIVYGQTDVHILQNESEVSFGDTGLSRVYDGVAPSIEELQNRIIGKYNGTKGQLRFTYYKAGSDQEIDTPVDVGQYQVKVTSVADGNENYVQNYTPLEQYLNFEITPREITLHVGTDWQVNDDILNNQNNRWAAHGSNSGLTDPNYPGLFLYGDGMTELRNNSASQSYYILTGKDMGLVTSDVLRFSIVSETNLPRGKYYYKNAIATQTGFTFDYNGYKFAVTWDVYYDGTITPSGGTPITNPDKSENYNFILDYYLDVHYPYMNVDVRDMEYEYDGDPKTLVGIDKNIHVNLPDEADCEFLFGNSSNNIILTSYSQTNPGKYYVYFKISHPGYENYEGSTALTIKFKSRDGMLDVTNDLGKVYDNIAYDGSSLPTVTWKVAPSPNDPLPHNSTWKMEYFLAEQVGSEWRKVGDALPSVLDAGDYFYRLVIPAGTYYSETVIEKHFTIARKTYTISNPVDGSGNQILIKKPYNGLAWSYNLALNPDRFVIDGLLADHALKVANLISNSSNVGIYSMDSVTNQGIYMEFNSGFDYVIWDAVNNRDVRDNYTYIIDVTVEIEKADMTLKFPDQIVYNYPGSTGYITPIVKLIIPSEYSSNMEYSLDGITWQSEPISVRNIGSYTLHVRVLNVPNYNDITLERWDFKIEKAMNVLTMEDLTRPYNGNVMEYPIIHTLDRPAALADPTLIPGLKISWFFFDEGTQNYQLIGDGSTPPSAVGRYAINIIYPSTANYQGMEQMFYFEITPLKVSIDWSSMKGLVYNAQERRANFNLVADSNSSLNLLGMLSEGIDYKITYYKDSAELPTGVLPKNASENYKVKFEFINDAAKNYSFDLENSVIFSTNSFSIAKCEIMISGAKNVQHNGSKAVLPLPELSISGLPSAVEFLSGVITARTEQGTYSAAGVLPLNNFSTNFRWITNTVEGDNPVIQFISDGQSDSLDNYRISVNLTININNGKFSYSVSRTEVEYDGNPHQFKFEPIFEASDQGWVEYSINGGSTWVSDMPSFINASSQPYHVIVRVHSTMYGDPDNNYFVYLGADPTDSDYHQFEVEIHKAQTIITADHIDLNKIYDDKNIVNPPVYLNGPDNRDSNIIYNYYWKDETNGYQPVDIISVRNAGEYRLVITVSDSENYFGTNGISSDPNATALPIEIDFTISKRTAVVSMEPQSKVYDGFVWKALVSNDIQSGSLADIVGVAGIAESGLLPNHILMGVVQTVSGNAGEYKVSDHFRWESEYSVTDTSSIVVGDRDVTNNYNILFDLNLTIQKASFDIKIHNYKGQYDPANPTPKSINIEFLTYPFVQGLSTPEDYQSLIRYSDHEDGFKDLSIFDYIKPTYVAGAHIVYFVIEAPNYETYLGQGLVEISSLTTGITILDYDGKAQDKVYNGVPYNTDSIKIQLSDGSDPSTRTITYEFFNSDGTPLTTPPTDAGDYYFVIHVSASADDIYGPATSDEISFTIVKQEVEVVWKATTEILNADGTITYKMIYTGDVVTPSATATGIIGEAPTTSDYPIELEITVDPTSGSSIVAGGPYRAKANIKNTIDANNYRLKNDTIEYEITAQPGGFIPDPDDPNPGAFPPDDPLPPMDDNYWGIDFNKYQRDPFNGKPFDYMDVVENNRVFVEMFIQFVNGAPKSYTLTVDIHTGEVIEVNNTPLPPNSKFNFKFEFPKVEDENGDKVTNITTPTTNIKAVLKDPLNTAWNIDGEVNDKPIALYIDATDVNPDPNDPDKYPVVKLDKSSYEKTYIFDGTPVTFEVDVYLTYGPDSNKPDVLLKENKDYEIVWFQNDVASDIPNGIKGSFVVKGKQGSGYSFMIGDETSTLYTDHADSFTLLAAYPSRFEIKEDSIYKFVKIDQDFTPSQENVTFTVLDNTERTDLIKDMSDAEIGALPIRIGNTHDGQKIRHLLDQLKNPKEDIVIYGVVDDSGTQVKLYDESDETIDIALAKKAIITNGLQLSLYKHDMPHTNENQLDYIELLLYGDLNCDGFVNISDVTRIKQIMSQASDVDWISETSIIYQAGLINSMLKGTGSPIISVSDLTVMTQHLGQTIDINADFYEECDCYGKTEEE